MAAAADNRACHRFGVLQLSRPANSWRQAQHRRLHVNTYIGADLAPALLIDPTKPDEVIATTTKIYAEIVASRPEVRLAAIAADIATRQPAVVGAVELYGLELAPALGPTTPGQFSVVYDYLQLLTNELARLGANYQAVVVSQESVVTLPLLNLQNLEQVLFGRLTDREAILVRSDLPPGHLRIGNTETGQFQTRIMLPASGVDLERGWALADASIRGQRVRIICAHLEDDAAPAIQFAQAEELLAGPADTAMPVILLGDFNADPLGRNGTVTYPLFGAAGFKDTWLQLNRGNPQGGLTWGHDALLANRNAPLEWRLDLVLYRGAILQPTQAEVIDISTGRTQPPLWGTDHQAVAATFAIGNHRWIAPQPATTRTLSVFNR